MIEEKGGHRAAFFLVPSGLSYLGNISEELLNALSRMPLHEIPFRSLGRAHRGPAAGPITLGRLPGAGFWFVPIAAAIRGVHASCTRCACAFGWISLPNRQAYTCVA